MLFVVINVNINYQNILSKVTAIIPTFNEEKNIQRALNSVAFADEIIVIDSFSTDKTLEIVNRKTVKLLQRKFDDFSSQKNYAIEQATHNWIFLLDADEEIPPLLEKEILDTVQLKKTFDCYYMYRTFFMENKKLLFSGIQNDKVIRLFKKDKNRYQGKVHEKIKTKGTTGFLKNKLNHYSYRNYHQYTNKLKHYASLQAQELYEKGSIVTPYHIFLKPIIRFVIHFIIRFGLLDGWRGLVISYAHSYGVYLRYVELIKLKQLHKNQQ